MAKPVYALVGADSFLQVQELGKVLTDLPADAQRSDYDGETAELADVLDDLRSFAMFGGGKVVTIRNADHFVSRFREPLEEYLAKPSNSATLVLRLSSLPANQRIYKIIKKVGEVVACEAPKNAARWAIDHAKRAHNATLTPDGAAALVELLGCELGRIDTEIAKLAITAEGKRIDAQAVGENVVSQREQEMKELTAELATGQKPAAVRRWRELVRSDPSAEFRAVTWLTMWLEDMRLFLRAPNVFFAKAGWKYQGPRLDMFKNTAKKLGMKQIDAMTDALVEVDYRSKSGLGEAADNVEVFILSAPL